MKIDTNLKYLPSEDLLNEIYDLHVGSGHCGRDLLNKKIKEKFANVTIENISAFLKTCQFCTTKRKSSEKKGTVVKPILSKDAFSRFQVDYIDLQSWLHDSSFFFTALPLCCAELASLQEGADILNGYIGKLLLDLFVQQVPTTVTTADMKIIDLVQQVLTGQVLEIGVDLHKPADDLPIHLNFSHLEPSLVIIV
jgi:hypothetical protein